MFLRYNALPTASNYDAAYQGALQANQYAVIPSTTAGIYYVMINGQTEPGAATPVTLVANVLPFQISDVIPDDGGDSRYVTTTILGAQFDPQAIVKLVRPGFAEYEPVSYQVVDKTKIIAIFDLTGAPHGLYDVEVINPDGAVALAPYRYLVEQALPPDVNIALGGPARRLGRSKRPLWFLAVQHHQRGHPLCRDPIRHPEHGQQQPRWSQTPYLALTTNLQGSPNVANVPWDSITPVVNTNGQVLATGYAMDFADKSNTTLSFLVQTYPNGLGAASSNPPASTAFAFNIVGSATPLTTAEFIAQQTQLAATLRTNILADPTASSALQTLAADPTNWTDLYLTALTAGRPIAARRHAAASLAKPGAVQPADDLGRRHPGRAGGQANHHERQPRDFFNQVQQWYGSTPNTLSKYIGTGTDTTTAGRGRAPMSRRTRRPRATSISNASQPTHYEAFYVYVPYANDFDQGEEDNPDSDETHPENPNFINVAAPNFAPFFKAPARSGQASINGPLGFGSQQFVPLGQPCLTPFNSQNAPAASSTVGEVRIVSQLDPNLDPRTFRLGDLKIGDIHGSQSPAASARSRGISISPRARAYILRVSAGIDINSDTMTWLLQAIDPLTGEVIQDPDKGLLPPDNARAPATASSATPCSPMPGWLPARKSARRRACSSTPRRRWTRHASPTPSTARRRPRPDGGTAGRKAAPTTRCSGTQ